MLKRSRVLSILCAATLMTGSLTVQVIAQETVSAEKRIERVEKQLRAVQRKVFGSGNLPADTPSDQAAPSSISSRKLVADMSVKISAIERQMREITGRIEAIEYAQEQFTKKLDYLSKDTSIRFEEMRTTAAVPPTSPSVDVKKDPVKIPELAVPKGSVASQFEWAFGYVAKNDLKNGEKALNLFLKANPEGDLSANAHFWLGRVHFQEGQYGKAAEQFLTVFEENPKHKKAPESLLELGNSMIKLGENASACEAYLEFRRAFPDANPRLKSRVDADEKKAKC